MLRSYLVPYLTLYPLIIGLVALAIGAIRRERMLRRLWTKQLKEKVAEVLAIPEGYVEVQTGHLPRRAGLKFSGTLMLVAAGTPAIKRMLDTLILLERAGIADMVGSILAYDCESSSLVDFANKLPVVYKDRLILAKSRDFPNGYNNQDPEWVESKIVQWGVELKDAVEAVVKLHDERNNGRPGQIIQFISLGGHAFPGVYLTRELHPLVGEAQFVGVVNLPRKTKQRHYFKALKPEWEDAGIDAWLLSDQLQPDWVTVDSVVSAIFASLASSGLGSDGNIAINNTITNAAGVGVRGGMVRFTYHYSDVVAHPFQVDTNGTIKYYVPQDAVMSELRRVIASIENGEGSVSIDVPIKERSTNIYDIAVAQLAPRVMRDIRDEIERSRDLEDVQLKHLKRPHRHPTIDYEPVYSSWSLSVNTTHPRCRILVVRLQAIDAPLDVVIAPLNERSTFQLPNPTPVAATSNGRVLPDDLDF